jgi:hypothetical protein
MGRKLNNENCDRATTHGPGIFVPAEMAMFEVGYFPPNTPPPVE